MAVQDPEKLVREVGRRLAELRVQAGLTQEQFAERSAVSLKYVQRVEAGRENLTLRSLFKLASDLGVTVAAVFRKPRTLRVQQGRPVRQPRPRRRKVAPNKV